MVKPTFHQIRFYVIYRDYTLNAKDLYNLSACIWLLICAFLIFSVQRFIVKRYEQETNLSQLQFFNEHLKFSGKLPSFFRSSIYTCHLILFIWGWKMIKKGKEKKNIRYYNDTGSRDDVLKYFTKQEIFCVKFEVFALIVISLHVIGMDIIGWFWPGLLG